MQLKKDEYIKLSRLVWMLEVGEYAEKNILEKAGKTKKQVIAEASESMQTVRERWLKDNKRTADYVAKQRTVNKDFSRGKGIKAVKFTDEQH